MSRDNNRNDTRRVIFLQFSDNDYSSPSQIAALIGQNRRAADIGSIGDPASLATAMATLSKQSRVIASIPASRPCAPEDAHRSADGSIDVEFYKSRAHAIRGAAMARLVGALQQMVRAALARSYAVILAKRGKE